MAQLNSMYVFARIYVHICTQSIWHAGPVHIANVHAGARQHRWYTGGAAELVAGALDGVIKAQMRRAAKIFSCVQLSNLHIHVQRTDWSSINLVFISWSRTNPDPKSKTKHDLISSAMTSWFDVVLSAALFDQKPGGEGDHVSQESAYAAILQPMERPRGLKQRRLLPSGWTVVKVDACV
jgi:hypothetical protein